MPLYGFEEFHVIFLEGVFSHRKVAEIKAVLNLNFLLDSGWIDVLYSIANVITIQVSFLYKLA